MLPNPTHLFRRLGHGLAGLTRERASKFRHVHDNTVDAVSGRGMRIGKSPQSRIFRTRVLTCPLRKADKESLVGGEIIRWLQVLVIRCVFPGVVRENLPA